MLSMNKILRHPWAVVAVAAAITLFFAAQLPRAELDNNNLRFVPANDPARITSAWIDDTFGSTLFILVGLRRTEGTVFDAPFLRRVLEFTEIVEEMEITGDINSIMTTDYIAGDADTIFVENLVPDGFSGTNEEIAALRSRINSWDIYSRSLVSDDFTSTQIFIPLNIPSEDAGASGVEGETLLIRDTAREMFENLAEVYVTGMPVMSSTINEAMGGDLRYLIPLVIAVILLIVYLPLRRLFFVALSLAAVLAATVWTIGAMPLFGVKLSILSTVLPVILIAIGNSYGLHVVVHYIDGCGRGICETPASAVMTREAHTDFVLGLLGAVRKPIFLASVTTMASLAAFCFTGVEPIRDFGFFATFGVFASFVLSIFLTPAILIIRGPRPLLSAGAAKSGRKRAAMPRVSYNDRIARLLVRVTGRRGTVLFVCAAAIAVSAAGASKLVIDNIFVDYFKPDNPLVQSDRFIREEFGGSKVISVVAEADSPEVILHPDTLAAMDGLAKHLEERLPDVVGKVMGFSDFIKRTNQVFNIGVPVDGGATGNAGAEDAIGAEAGAESAESLIALLDRAVSVSNNMDANALVRELKKLVNYEGAAFYEIPSDPARYGKANKDDLQRLIANYLVMLASGDNDYSNDPLEPTVIKSTVMLRTVGQIDTNRAVREIRAYADANFPPEVRITAGGGALVEGATNMYVVNSVWTSMAIAFVSLFVIVSVVNRSALMGVIGLLPLLSLVLMNFAVMGFLGIKLNIATAMIASVTMGIGIDYTVHFIEAFKREAAAVSGGEAEDADGILFRAYRTSGIAIIADAVSTGLGFAVLLLSRFVSLAHFGLLVALSLLLSAVVGLVVVPAIMTLRMRSVANRRID